MKKIFYTLCLISLVGLGSCGTPNYEGTASTESWDSGAVAVDSTNIDSMANFALGDSIEVDTNGVFVKDSTKTDLSS